ncbi:uncharacterized protein EI90DRAFT_3127331 [Cantharellus anzutake]|uniref:uncharacterized protein n=1 Tax=Cantharellus anzutake TaxID=1750568 RepID=UPI0019032F27|nr:uncharacterized protein EI90DRAFT_3127331 [Cantharellus anzutake]KAF8327276.1 hypothetical protein EI90DRAFT_3127331 [Cantharellus anzutake]
MNVSTPKFWLSAEKLRYRSLSHRAFIWFSLNDSQLFGTFANELKRLGGGRPDAQRVRYRSTSDRYPVERQLAATGVKLSGAPPSALQAQSVRYRYMNSTVKSSAAQEFDSFFMNRGASECRLSGERCSQAWSAHNPEEYETAGLKIQQAVEQAIQESEENGVSKTGKDATPWLLRRVAELTGGSSIPNIPQYACVTSSGSSFNAARLPWNTQDLLLNGKNMHQQDAKSSQAPKARLVVLGAAAVDVVARADTDPTLIAQSTVPGQVSITFGGVARNMAEAAHRSLSSLDPRGSSASSSSYVQLVSPIGTDKLGAVVSTEITQIGMRSDGLLSGLSGGNRHFSALDTFGFSEAHSPFIHFYKEGLPTSSAFQGASSLRSKHYCLDGNLSSDTISDLVQFASKRNIPSKRTPAASIQIATYAFSQ